MQNYLQGYKGKSVLITGGAGCIGSNLARELLESDVKSLVILDDLSASCRWNIYALEKRYDNLQFVQCSVTNDFYLKAILRKGIDIVFHLAAHFANQNSVDNPESDLETNGLGILKVLEYSQKYNVGRFVYASSGCSVYGSQSPLPLKEEYVSLNLDTPYQIHKLLGELYCNYFTNYYKFPIAIARFFNVYGKGEIPGAYRNVIPNFIWRALHNEPLLITGTGEETRDFTFVEDIVDGTMRLGIMPEAVGQAFNLASEKETKVIDIANIINDLTNNKSGIKYVAVRDWDKIIRRRASIEKAHNILGYEPKTKIEEGIKVVYDWIVDNQDKIERDARF
jgi:UDP-glucose 4-epimerase